MSQNATLFTRAEEAELRRFAGTAYEESVDTRVRMSQYAPAMCRLATICRDAMLREQREAEQAREPRLSSPPEPPLRLRVGPAERPHE